jgi:hypothetical protein
MFFNEVVSHQGGWEILTKAKPKQTQGILDSLFSISPEKIQLALKNQIKKQIESEIYKIQRSNELLSRNSEQILNSDDYRVRSLLKNGVPNNAYSIRESGTKVIRERYENLDIDINSEVFSEDEIKTILSQNQNHTATHVFITRSWNSHMKLNDWPFRITENSDSKKVDIYIKHLQERVSVKLIISEKANLANWIYAETKKIHEADVCDVSVILVPMNSYTQSYIGNQSAINTFESIKSNIEILSPIKALTPFVIIGFSHLKTEIKTYDSVWNEDTINPDNLIDKCIEFSPEHYQAGMGILSYFGEIIKTKHPDIQASVKIEQDGNFVRLHIETEDGTKEIIEKTLEDYTLVVSNQAPVEILLDNKLEIMALKNKLEIASLEVRHTRDMLTLSREHSNERVLSLEEDIQHLRSQIGSQMSLTSQGNKIIEMHAETSNKMVNGFVESSQYLIRDLITRTSNNSEVREALNLINNKLENGITENDEFEVKSALEIVNESAPSVFKDLKIALKNTAYGVSGNIAYKWLVDITNILC